MPELDAPTVPAASGAKGKIGAALTRKLGPLPTWAWAGVIAGGVIGWRVLSGKPAFGGGGAGDDGSIPGLGIPGGTGYPIAEGTPDIGINPPGGETGGFDPAPPGGIISEPVPPSEGPGPTSPPPPDPTPGQINPSPPPSAPPVPTPIATVLPPVLYTPPPTQSARDIPAATLPPLATAPPAPESGPYVLSKLISGGTKGTSGVGGATEHKTDAGISGGVGGQSSVPIKIGGITIYTPKPPTFSPAAKADAKRRRANTAAIKKPAPKPAPTFSPAALADAERRRAKTAAIKKPAPKPVPVPISTTRNRAR